MEVKLIQLLCHTGTLELIRPKRRITMISAYAPTLPNSERNPVIREDFYNELESLIKLVPKRNTLILAGDFNAQTGSAYHRYSENMGMYGKGTVNSNGEELLLLANRNDLILTNTLYQHKLSHTTTWESPFRNIIYKDGRVRHNPFRNQIDYILTRRKDRHMIRNSRSHNGMSTLSDHRLVRLTMNTKAQRYRGKFPKRLNLGKLNDPTTQQKYAFTVEMKLIYKEDTLNEVPPTLQEKWNNIVEANSEAAKEVLGYVKRRKSTNTTVTDLSEKQRKLGTLINATRNQTRKDEVRKMRNTMLKKIHQLVKEEQYQAMTKNIEEIEKSRDDSTRMFKAVRTIYSTTEKKPLCINTEEGTTANPEQQLEIVTSYFQSMFTADQVSQLPQIPPAEMKTKFTREEIQRAVKSLKDNKSVGADQLKAEQLKYGPTAVLDQIAEILNEIAKTGEYPKEMKLGLLVPLQKPGKPKGPPSSLRPIILLSVIRKILAICLIRRISHKIDAHIPITQAAYRPGRSTTEQVFTIKLLAEKAITSTDYTTHILLMDMSKAFDTVHRHRIMEDLKDILEPDELHMVKILIEDVILAVKIDQSRGQEFTTNIGTPQGDCLSPTLFTLYLAKALSNGPKCTILSEHNYSRERPPSHILDHPYNKQDPSQKAGVLLDLQYADDISWIGSNRSDGIEHQKKTIPAKLEARNLCINPSKTEEYTVNIGNATDGSWRKCKYLGSLLDTSCDISKRKQSAMTAYHRLKPIFSDKKLPVSYKARIFTALTGSIFLYNCELWTLTEKALDGIDSFQRKLLRWMLNIRYPAKLSCEEVYRRTGMKPWTSQIATRRVRWFGHVARLNPEAPASLALNEALNTETKKPRGGQRFTWIKQDTKDLEPFNLSVIRALDSATDRVYWRQIVRRVGS